MTGRRWELLRDGVVLAHVVQTDSDFPWRSGTMTPTDAFAKVAPQFAAAQAFADREEWDTPESDAAMDAILDLGLSMRDVEHDDLYAEVLVAVTATGVSWRC